MCITCDCGEHDDSHGENTPHITRAQFEAAAKAADITPLEAAQNVLKVYHQEEAEVAEAKDNAVT